MRRALFVLAAVTIAWWLARGSCPLAPWLWDDASGDLWIGLREDGTGDMLEWTEDIDLPITDIAIRWRASGERLRFEYLSGSRSPPREIRYRVERGTFETPRGRYRCRLRFDENPFPPDAHCGALTFYADYVY